MGTYDAKKNVNEPEILDGMTRIMFTEPTNDAKGEVIKEGDPNFDINNWYSYPDKKWANVETADGSMWVWIPRFAYKINSSTQTVDVKFLVGTTDIYYDENNNVKTAIRQEKDTDVIDATKDYVVHPAFTDETKIKFANGGWDKELSGIWVAKFEAGYASGNNGVTPKASNVNYSQTWSWVPNVELKDSDKNTTNGGACVTARNWLDGIYGSTATAIKYPVFQGITYSMNYINVNDAFNISKALTDPGNIYNLNSSTTDSHLMKNSEWGACSYLSKSQYGLGSTNIKINNITLESNGVRTDEETAGGKDTNNVKSVYSVTGVTDGSENNGGIGPSDKINFGSNLSSKTDNTPVDSIYSWNQLGGVGASTTGTIYGIYDMSGGTWERTAAYVPRNKDNGILYDYGKSVAYDKDGVIKTESTKYTTVYPLGDEKGSNIDEGSKTNYKANTKIYGDGVRETSTYGNNANSWYSDYSYFPAFYCPFFLRGGYYWDGSDAGSFAFSDTSGVSYYCLGFRPVLVAL